MLRQWPGALPRFASLLLGIAMNGNDAVHAKGCKTIATTSVYNVQPNANSDIVNGGKKCGILAMRIVAITANGCDGNLGKRNDGDHGRAYPNPLGQVSHRRHISWDVCAILSGILPHIRKTIDLLTPLSNVFSLFLSLAAIFAATFCWRRSQSSFSFGVG